MDMKTKRILLLALLPCLMMLLCSCRARTGISGQENATTARSAGIPDEKRQGNAADISADTAVTANDSQNDGENGEPGGKTRENPDAPRKEYDENAPAEIVPGAEHLLHENGEGNGASVSNDDSETLASRVNERAEDTAVRTVAEQEAEQKGVSGDADAADSAMTYFEVLLQERTGSLFECQRQNLYWETEGDHVTVHKTSPEHSLILNAGCYDVSARLLPENLRVDDGWVVRKNPGVIVKIVESGVLGSGVHGTGSAKAVCEALRNREGWAAVDAVKNGRILLLSREMLEAPYLRTAAMVMIARTADPSLFADVDPDTMLRMLTEEAAGTLPTGIFFYCKED